MRLRLPEEISFELDREDFEQLHGNHHNIVKSASDLRDLSYASVITAKAMEADWNSTNNDAHAAELSSPRLHVA